MAKRWTFSLKNFRRPRELADNFCYYSPQYDTIEGQKYDWAKDTLRMHAGDKREYTYTYEEFEQAKTHDNLWNAAQRASRVRWQNAWIYAHVLGKENTGMVRYSRKRFEIRHRFERSLVARWKRSERLRRICGPSSACTIKGGKSERYSGKFGTWLTATARRNLKSPNTSKESMRSSKQFRNVKFPISLILERGRSEGTTCCRKSRRAITTTTREEEQEAKEINLHETRELPIS